MAIFTATITLDDGTVLGTWTTTPLDAVVQQVIAVEAPILGYCATIDDGNGNMIPNPESACTYMLRTQRALAVAQFNQGLADSAAVTARNKALAHPVTF